MAVAKHRFVSLNADGADTSLLRPSDWNADQDILYTVVSRTSNYTIATNAEGEITDDVIRCSGTMTLTVPLATGSGRRCIVSIASGAVAITIARTGSDEIGTGTGFTTSKVGDAFLLVDEAAGKWTLGILGSQSGRLLQRTIYTSGSSATHTFAAGVGRVRVVGVAQGGGGGGTSGTSNNAVASGGAGGGFFEVTSLSPGASLTYTVGTAAGGGGSAGGNGTAGSDTVVVLDGTTYTAKGGAGGLGQASGTSATALAGGAGVVGTNGDLLGPGQPGGHSYRASATVGVSGTGGNSIMGAGGAALTAQGAGNAGTGRGGGGGGACSRTANQTGGAGAGGVVIIEEYSL